jgi:hypothetical protein
MANVDTELSILSNIETILTSDLALRIEDLNANATATEPHAFVFYEGTDFLEPYKEKKAFNVMRIQIGINFNRYKKREGELLAIEYGRLLKENITTETLNTTDLLASELVYWVEHLSSQTLYEHNILTLVHDIECRYKEL